MNNKADFNIELKALVLAVTEKAEPADGLKMTEPLFGNDSRLQLDSLDALQVSMAIQKHYGVRMADSKETRRALVSLENLAIHLQRCLQEKSPAGL